MTAAPSLSRDAMGAIATYDDDACDETAGHVFAVMSREPEIPALVTKRDAVRTALAEYCNALAAMARTAEETRFVDVTETAPEPSNEVREARRRQVGRNRVAVMRAIVGASPELPPFPATVDDDEPSVGDEEEARAARLEAPTIPPPDTARSAQLSPDGSKVTR